MSLPFLDTNVILRHLVGDHPDHSPRSTEMLRRVERGELRVRISEMVVFECVFTLEKHHCASRTDIRDGILSLLELGNIVLPGKERLRHALDLYVEYNLPFADAYHAALMAQLGLTEVISFDHQLDRVPSIKRSEP